MSWADEGPDDGPVYTDLAAFVAEWLAPHYRRSLETGGRCWCPAWQEHEEAVSRLTGLWRAYEKLAAGEDGTGLSTFWLQHVDPTMAVLLDDAGPFKACAHEHSDRLPPLPTGTART